MGSHTFKVDKRIVFIVLPGIKGPPSIDIRMSTRPIGGKIPIVQLFASNVGPQLAHTPPQLVQSCSKAV